jgi:predicted O-linked N-acetylglucosamine transferase (SPINDLY family)
MAKRVVGFAPDGERAHLMCADALGTLNRLAAAIQSLDRAIALNPSSTEAHGRRGAILLKQRRYAEALASFTKAVALDRQLVQGWAGIARALGKLKRHQLAISAYRRALEIEPEYPFLKGRLLQQMLLSCDWKNLAPLIEDIERDVEAGRESARPFAWQAVSTSPQSLRACAEIFNTVGSDCVRARPASPRASATNKIRLGYLSGEFCEHSTSYLRVGVFEHHDKERFELIAFDNGWDDGGPTRARINRAVDCVVDIRELSDDEAARRIAEMDIDILIDCNGFNGRNRARVCMLRPAPLQMAFPGYPGTLGASYVDYILCDATVIPEEDRKFYAEQVVQMPHSYQANDRSRPISARILSRTELGLPEVGMVFCCFNNNYKIMPATFDCWVRILNAVPGSVLWLLADNPASVNNLRREAEQRGLDPERLIFADRMPVADHLARHRAADLFLDTLPCNAHATASDALWAGLPVLTCLGTSFSGRVAASLLRAADLPELITTTLDDYVDLAVHFGSDSAELARIKRELAVKRLSAPLFDTALFTKHLEAAYGAMHKRRCDGLAPAPILVAC